jgi:hypothetical protein
MYVRMYAWYHGGNQLNGLFLGRLDDLVRPVHASVDSHAPCACSAMSRSVARRLGATQECGVGQSEHEHVAEEQALGEKTPALANALLPSTAAAKRPGAIGGRPWWVYHR